MINPKCLNCGQELKEYGGILISPPRLPQYEYEQIVNKYHLCRNCFNAIFWVMIQEKKEIDKK